MAKREVEVRLEAGVVPVKGEQDKPQVDTSRPALALFQVSERKRSTKTYSFPRPSSN